MESTEEKTQLEEIKAQLRRVERIPVRTSAARRDTLKRLIDLAHSPYSSLKSYAANNLRLFIKDFPDLEDDAINAVYDLCEDQVSKVRIDGYYAIIQVSKEQKKWVKRNADVLVQLLQSDEPDEVVVVKKALTEHLDMDPVVTLGVLCDQIIPLEAPIDDEEQAIRDNLRSLVLAFLTGEAKRGIVERHAHVYGSPAETVLVNGLLKAITKLEPGDISIIIRDILLALPSYGLNSARGSELLETILEETRVSFKGDLSRQGGERSPLTKTRSYLDLASFLAIDRHVAHPTALLRFCCASFVSRVTLMKLTEDAQAYILTIIANALSASDSEKVDASSAETLSTLRKQVVDACVSLLSCFSEAKSSEIRPWPACRTLLQACARRKDESGWVLPTHLTPVLQKIQTLAEAREKENKEQDSMREIQNLIRSLLQTVSLKPPASHLAPAANTDASKGMNTGKPNGSIVKIKRKRDDQIGFVPPAATPPTAKAAPNTPNANTAPALRPERPRQPQIPSIRPRTMSTPAAAVAAALGDQHLDRKRARTTGGAGGGAARAAPSLLSRLEVAPNGQGVAVQSPPASIPTKRRGDFEGTSHQRADLKQHGPVRADRAPAGGYSIKGAASRPTLAKEELVASSLLDRMTGDHDSGEAGGQRWKKRTKNG